MFRRKRDWLGRPAWLWPWEWQGRTGSPTAHERSIAVALVVAATGAICLASWALQALHLFEVALIAVPVAAVATSVARRAR